MAVSRPGAGPMREGSTGGGVLRWSAATPEGLAAAMAGAIATAESLKAARGTASPMDHECSSQPVNVPAQKIARNNGVGLTGTRASFRA